MVTQSEVEVLRDGKVTKLHSVELVPGDVVIIVKSDDLLEADMVLLEGSIIMNEAILTGESVPITKVHVTANDEEPFDVEKHKKHIIYCGTQVLQVRGASELRAVVVKTAYDTAKGEMIRSILFPKPMDLHIYSDFLKILYIFVPLGLAAMVWSLVHWSMREGVGLSVIIFNSLDLLTFVVPPILPATITAINLWAQIRLKKHKIFCLSSNYISLAGPVDVVCFDKTGTLTEEDLSLEGVVPSENGEFVPPIYNLNKLRDDSPLCNTLATCHSVVVSTDGSFIGHPLDIKIFCALQWDICQPNDYICPVNQNETHEGLPNQYGTHASSPNQYEIQPQFVVRPKIDEKQVQPKVELAVFKTYPFDSGDQRMTVIGRKQSGRFYELFVKGAPEKIASICSKETVPDTFPSVLAWYTRQGLRVVAVAYKPLPASFDWECISNTPRELLEVGSIFLGLVILQNRLKPETLPALQVIHQAEIATVMITGDNLLTATCIGRQCGLIRNTQQLIFVRAQHVPSSVKAAQHIQIHFYDSEHNTNILTKSKLKPLVNPDYVFGTDGESFQLISQYEPDLFQKLIHRGKIFARMKPDQKIEVVEALQKLGHQVAMCGDGCNDCGALKAAHAGISLSSTEASVAAPFTSMQQDIGCIINLIREGRASLISMYASFKYNLANCFIALTGVLLLFTIFTEPSDTQYLIMDFFLMTIPSLVLGNTAASTKLCKQRPSRRIIHPLHIVSILSFLGLQILLFVLTWEYLKEQSWFVPYNMTTVAYPPEPCYESTVLILQSFFTYIIGAFIFSHGLPFRKPFYNNKILTVYFISALALCLTFTFCQTEWLYKLLGFKIIPYGGFTWTIFLSVVLMGIVCYMWERWLLYGAIEKKLIPMVLKYWGPRYPHEHMEQKLRDMTDWPQLEEYTSSSELWNEKSADQHPMEIEAEYEDPSDKIHGFFRRSTRRHKFDADVKYIDELKPTHKFGNNKIIYATTPLPSPTSPSSDYDYAEPLNGIDPTRSSGRKESSTKGIFRTFQRSIRKKTEEDDGTEPYEVGPLRYNPEESKDNSNFVIQKNAEGEDTGLYEVVPLIFNTDEYKSKSHSGIQKTAEDEETESYEVIPLIYNTDESKGNSHSGSQEMPNYPSESELLGMTEATHEPIENIVHLYEKPFNNESLISQAQGNVAPSGMNLIMEMNNEWAKLRSSLHESFKEFPEDTQNLPAETQKLSEVTQNLSEVTQNLSEEGSISRLTTSSDNSEV